jgi:site-specific DNA recombinase
MQDQTSREQRKDIYRREDSSDKTLIPAKPKVKINASDVAFRACAYCRVSTDSDEQLSSFELQQTHYRKLAEEHPNWDLSRIYADEGISGTSLKNRDAFNEMIAACKEHEYDLIVTKSVSRFARNLVDCVSLIRTLKGLNPPVGVYFETDNLYTLSENSEFMLSFLATFAQEESVKRSEAMNWSIEERNKNGQLLTPALLGYDRPRNAVGDYVKYGILQINEAEAAIVRFIFGAYLRGMSQVEIAAFLTDIGCKTKKGNTEWSPGSIAYILTNERYCGNVLTWKTVTTDMFEHKHRKNRRDRDQYLYRNHHPAIISEKEFDAVQVLIENRKHHLYGGFPQIRVISEGIFNGYVPVNHHWVNDDPAVYYDASNSVGSVLKVKRIEKKSISAFDFNGYQVVRNQFTQIRYEGPSFTITGDKITFNMFCMKKYDDVCFIQLLLHPTERKIAIRPCGEKDVHSIRWRPDPLRPIHAKSLKCPYFSSAIHKVMDWDPDFAYRIRGVWAKRGLEQIIVFDLSNAVPAVFMDAPDSKAKRRVELCPAEWTDDFGDEFYEHVLENGFYYLTPECDWNAAVESIPAPGIEQIIVPSSDQLQLAMNDLLKETETKNG